MGELERLLSATGRAEVWERHFDGKPERDRLLLALLAYVGLRRGELLGLDWDDVDLSRRLLRVRKAKGDRQRTVPIHPALVPLIVDYYEVRLGRETDLPKLLSLRRLQALEHTTGHELEL